MVVDQLTGAVRTRLGNIQANDLQPNRLPTWLWKWNRDEKGNSVGVNRGKSEERGG